MRYVNPTTRIGGVETVVVAERPVASELDDAPYDDEQYVRFNGDWVPYIPPAPDTVAPAPPTDLSASGSINESEGTVDYALTWDAPTTNEDTTPLTDFAYYVVRWRYTGTGPWTSFVSNDAEFLLPGATLGGDIEWAVMARDYSGNDSTWASDTISGTIDLTGPDQPSPPILTSHMGAITATWDGLDSGGDPPPPDFSHLDFFVSTAPGGPWTLAGRISGASSTIITGIPVGETRFVSSVAEDASGNTSVRSGAASIVVQGVTGPDISEDAITGRELAEGVVDAIHLTPEAFVSSRMQTRAFAGDGTTATTTSTTGDVMGASGAQGTFTAPASGIIEVTVMAELWSSVAGEVAACSFEVREGSTVGSGTVVDAAAITKAALSKSDQGVRSSMAYLVTGLVPGSVYNIATLLFAGASTASAAWARLHVRPSF
jgi:hypothetical protein